MLDAARIGGVNPLRLFHDTTASETFVVGAAFD
jgi:hypothetical protein